MKQFRKAAVLAQRTLKEMLRDLLTLFFGLAFPILILLLLSLIQSHIPVDMFRIEQLAPGIVVFGQSFLSLFGALLIARDRSTSFLMRLYAAPVTGLSFLLGYLLPLLPLALMQGAAGIRRGASAGAAHLLGACARAAGRAGLLAAVHRYRAAMRHGAQRQAGRRRMRRAADQPDCLAQRHLV